MARFQDGPPRLLEIKSGAKKPLTDSRTAGGGHVCMATGIRVETLEDALRRVRH
jgi:hypothetical protein